MFQTIDLINELNTFGQNAVVALAVGGAGALARLCWTTIRTIKLRRRYRLSGEYISHYEDFVDGKKVTQKANVKIEQKGLLMTGETKDLAGGRSWQIRGQIIEPAMLSGSYFRDDPHDPSRGVFFLTADIKHSGQIWEGLWAGFDSHNKNVMTGSYEWHRCVPVKVRRVGWINRGWLPVAVPLLSRLLGVRYITKEKLRAYTDAGDKRLLLIATLGKELVGVQLAELLSDSEVADIQSKCKTQLEGGRILAAKTIGMLKSLAVHEDYQRKGVGTVLTMRALRHLRAKGCVVVHALVWESGKVNSSENLLAAQGFKVACKIPDYWRDESVAEDYSCPVCGSPPCRCTAILMSKWF